MLLQEESWCSTFWIEKKDIDIFPSQKIFKQIFACVIEKNDLRKERYLLQNKA